MPSALICSFVVQSSTVKIRDNLMKLVDAALPAEVLFTGVAIWRSLSLAHFVWVLIGAFRCNSFIGVKEHQAVSRHLLQEQVETLVCNWTLLRLSHFEMSTGRPKNRVERKRAKAMILLLGHLEEASAANPQMDRLRGVCQQRAVTSLRVVLAQYPSSRPHSESNLWWMSSPSSRNLSNRSLLVSFFAPVGTADEKGLAESTRGTCCVC